MNRTILIFGLILLIVSSSGCITRETKTKSPVVGTVQPLATEPTWAPQTTQPPTTTPPPETTKPPSIISSLFEKGYEDISVQEVMKKIEDKEDFILLDVRTPMEFEEGYIEGAILIPHTEIEDRHKELNASKDKEIVVYCKAGVRSAKAAKKLVQLGYTNVKDMKEGTDGWIAEGGRLIQPTPTTTQPPATEPAWAPQTTQSPTTAPPEERLWTEKPSAIYRFDGSKTFEMNHGETVQVGDALIYFEYSIEGISGSCFPIPAWFLSIFRATEEGGVWEDTLAYSMDSVKTPQDITGDVHQRTDALDDYTIVVEDWLQEKIVLTLTSKK